MAQSIRYFCFEVTKLLDKDNNLSRDIPRYFIVKDIDGDLAYKKLAARYKLKPEKHMIVYSPQGISEKFAKFILDKDQISNLYTTNIICANKRLYGIFEHIIAQVMKKNSLYIKFICKNTGQTEILKDILLNAYKL